MDWKISVVYHANNITWKRGSITVESHNCHWVNWLEYIYKRVSELYNFEIVWGVSEIYPPFPYIDSVSATRIIFLPSSHGIYTSDPLEVPHTDTASLKSIQKKLKYFWYWRNNTSGIAINIGKWLWAKALHKLRAVTTTTTTTTAAAAAAIATTTTTMTMPGTKKSKSQFSPKTYIFHY